MKRRLEATAACTAGHITVGIDLGDDCGKLGPGADRLLEKLMAFAMEYKEPLSRYGPFDVIEEKDIG